MISISADIVNRVFNTIGNNDGNGNNGEGFSVKNSSNHIFFFCINFLIFGGTAVQPIGYNVQKSLSKSHKIDEFLMKVPHIWY